MSISNNKAFKKLLTGMVLSSFGSSITLIILPIIAVSLLDASASQLGLIAALASVPYILFGPLVGVYSDRMNRRKILIAADMLRAVVIISVIVVLMSGSLTIEILYAAVFIIGIGDVWFDVAHHAYIPSIVKSDDLLKAHSKLEMGYAVSKVTGPSAGGIIIQTLGAPFVLLVDFISYIASGLLIFSIKNSDKNKEVNSPKITPKRNFWLELNEGFIFLKGHELLYRLTFRLLIWMFITGGVFALLVMYLVKDLGLSSVTVGFLFSIMSIGLFIGSVIAPIVSKKMGVGKTIMLSNLLAPFALLLLASVNGNDWLSITLIIVSFIFYGVTFITYRINNIALRQSLTPKHLIGRVSALIRTVSVAATGVGALIIGVIADIYTLKAVFLGVSYISLLIAFIGLFSINLKHLRNVPSEQI